MSKERHLEITFKSGRVVDVPDISAEDELALREWFADHVRVGLRTVTGPSTMLVFRMDDVESLLFKDVSRDGCPR